MSKPVLSNGLSHTECNGSAVMAFCTKVVKESFENFKHNVRVGVLSFYMGKKTVKNLRVSVEEDNLDSELLPYFLPRQGLTIHFREGRVEQERKATW